jgi:hypothetical protein
VRDVLDATDDLDALASAASAQGVGTAALGRVELRLSATEPASCTIDGSWASDKSEQELTEALAIALAAAREDFTRASAAGPAGRLARILDDFQAMGHDANA